MKILCKKWVDNDFDVHVDVDDNTRCDDLTISGRVQKVMILVVTTKRAKRGDFMGFEGLKKKGLKSDVAQVYRFSDCNGFWEFESGTGDYEGPMKKWVLRVMLTKWVMKRVYCNSC